MKETKFSKYNKLVIPILDALKNDGIIDDYRIREDGGNEKVSVIEILERTLIKKRSPEEGSRLAELEELGYGLGISDEEMSYSTGSGCGFITSDLEMWESW